MLRRILRTAMVTIGIIVLIIGGFGYMLSTEEAVVPKLPLHVDAIIIDAYPHDCYVIQAPWEVLGITGSLTHVSEHLPECHWTYAMHFISNAVEDCDARLEIPSGGYGLPSTTNWLVKRLMDSDHRHFERFFQVDTKTDLLKMKSALEKQGYLAYEGERYSGHGRPALKLIYIHKGRKSDQQEVEGAVLWSLPGDKWVKPVTNRLTSIDGNPIPRIDMTKSYPDSDRVDYKRVITVYLKNEISDRSLRDIRSFWEKHAIGGRVYYDVQKPYTLRVISKHPFDDQDIRARFGAVEQN